MRTAQISFVTEFSQFPAGRFRSDGPFSGEAFRDDLLEPKLREFDQVELNLAGAMGYGSSFLEEAFGGLIRQGNFSSAALRQQLIIRCEDDPSIVDEIWLYIDNDQA